MPAAVIGRPGAGNGFSHKMRIMMTVVLTCGDNWLKHNRPNHVAAERWQQARKKLAVTSQFPQRCFFPWGGCVAHIYGQFPQMGQKTLGLYAIVGVPGADSIRARLWLAQWSPLQTRPGYGPAAVDRVTRLVADRVRDATCHSGGTAAAFLPLTEGRSRCSGGGRLNRVGKSASDPQGNLRVTGWRPNAPESKKSARQR
jgi:hypothetical protein